MRISFGFVRVSSWTTPSTHPNNTPFVTKLPAKPGGMDKHEVEMLLNEEGYLVNCKLITNDILMCLESYTALKVSVKEIGYPPEFSEKERLVCVSGSLPVTNSDGSWTIIQVSVYLPKSYPTSAPLCYVGMRSPDPSVTVPESAHVDCYGRIRGIAYLDPSPKIDYSLSVLIEALMDCLSPHSSLYAITNPVAHISQLWKNLQKKNNHHRGIPFSAMATQLRKSCSLKDVIKHSKKHKPHKGEPWPSHYLPHLNSSGESPCGSDSSDSPSYQPSQSSTSSLPPFIFGNTLSSSTSQHSCKHKHTPSYEEEPQQKPNKAASKESSSVLSDSIRSLEQSMAQSQEEIAYEKEDEGVEANVENSIAKMWEELETERKKGVDLNEKIKKLEENMSSLQKELAAEKETSSHLQNTVNALQCLELVWVIPPNEIHLSDKMLGGGGWGCVYEATYRGRMVAAKRLHQEILSPHNREKFEKEMRMSAICRHRNLVEFIGAVREERAIIVTELMDKTLREALTYKDVTQDNSQSVCMDVAEGLYYLHNLQPYPVIHRDISAPNVLLKVINSTQGDGINWVAKLSDFGSAQFAHLAQTPGPGCILYSAPEVRNDEPAQQTVKIDVYSYGVLLAEILTTDVPLDSLRGLLQKVEVQKPEFSALVHRCTNLNPIQRPHIGDVITQLQAINELC